MKCFLLLAALAFCSVSALAPLKMADHGTGIQNKYIVSIRKSGNRRDVMAKVRAFTVDAEFGHEFKGLNAFVVSVGKEGLDFIRSIPGVSHIEQDSIGHIDQNIASWGLDRTDQRDLPLNDLFYPEGDGAGANVFVVDTGIYYDHNDFGGRAEFFYDPIGGSNPNGDCNGHGTHCAGTVGGTLYGVAKQVKLWGVRTLNCQGSGSSSDTAAAMELIGDTGAKPGALSMSLSFTNSQVVDDAADYAIDRGFTVVTSSSNDNRDACFKSPQRNRRTISVGATDSTDARASFSNYGTCQDIWAPGVSIISCDISGPDASSSKSGTSMSCPHVAGVAGIKLALKPDSTPDEVKNAILTEATVGRVTDAKEEEGTPNLLLFSRLP
ncbi:aqualysin-1-like [Ptychodera flava]|uniref:aqualysin-1-like n=1 Tax=Ptychodera flava TaxID=63121 RepID=UPI00396A1095